MRGDIMPSFILRDLNPEFWAKVQAKAKAENTTIKAVILQLLTQWLGVLALVLFTVGCHTYIPEPLAPSPVVAVVAPTPMPAADLAPLSVSLSIGVARPSVGDNISFVASSSSAIVRADWAFGNGATTSTVRGDTAYAYPAVGTFLARVTLTASDGRTGSDQATVIVRRRETPPSTPEPTPIPTPAPALGLGLTCAPRTAPTLTPCNVTLSYGGTTLPASHITGLNWDWGDGTTTQTVGPDPVEAHPYATGTYTLFVEVFATIVTDGIPDGKRADTSTVLIIP